MVSDNREGMLRVSKLMYNAGLAGQSLEEVRGCLRLDPDDKSCRAHYKKVQVLVKAITDAQTRAEAEKWNDCLTSATKIIELNDSISKYILQGRTLVCRCGARVCAIFVMLR